MVKNVVGARPPLPQQHMHPRRFVPINLYHEFNAHSKELINESMASLSQEHHNYQLDELNWQDLLATVNQKPATAAAPPPPLPQSMAERMIRANTPIPQTSFVMPPPPPPPHTPPPPPPPSQATSAKPPMPPTLPRQQQQLINPSIVYPINLDPNPQIVHRRSDKKLLYTQEVAVRYLKPSTPEPPGDIIIRSV